MADEGKANGWNVAAIGTAITLTIGILTFLGSHFFVTQADMAELKIDQARMVTQMAADIRHMRDRVDEGVDRQSTQIASDEKRFKLLEANQRILDTNVRRLMERNGVKAARRLRPEDIQ